jgi:hypothetical protein
MSMELVTNYVIYIATWSWDCGGIYNGHFEFVIKFEVVTQGRGMRRAKLPSSNYTRALSTPLCSLGWNIDVAPSQWIGPSMFMSTRVCSHFLPLYVFCSIVLNRLVQSLKKRLVQPQTGFEHVRQQGVAHDHSHEVHKAREHDSFMKSSPVSQNSWPFMQFVYLTLREKNKGPTARNCADGNLLGPSAQHKNKVDKQDRCRHIITVGIDFLFIIMIELCLRCAVGTIYFFELFITRPKHFVNWPNNPPNLDDVVSNFRFKTASW